MAERQINSKVQQRNDTAVNWLLVNPILLRGELGIEYDTGKMKIGDGSSNWAALPYIGVGITQADVLNFVYPIGSIKITVTADNPSATIGGTWERWGNGKFPVAVDESNESFASAELTGGEYEHTLTVDELPEHSHIVTVPISGEAYETKNNGNSSYSVAVSGSIDLQTDSIGGGLAHNNIPPYITCYFWKRIA
jgi:hypothetical protein